VWQKVEIGFSGTNLHNETAFGPTHTGWSQVFRNLTRTIKKLACPSSNIRVFRNLDIGFLRTRLRVIGNKDTGF